tara:strand:- start:446540 stop:446920 length:381 start_codon:yes stop_codon:yes gene_type:complete
MRRVIVDYKKLTQDILDMLVEKYPDGYDDSDIISFRNAQNEVVDAVEVKTEDTIYLVKVSVKLAERMENVVNDDDDDDDDSIDDKEMDFDETADVDKDDIDDVDDDVDDVEEDDFDDDAEEDVDDD